MKKKIIAFKLSVVLCSIVVMASSKINPVGLEIPDNYGYLNASKAVFREVPYGASVTAHNGVLDTQGNTELSHPWSSMLCSSGDIDLATYGYVEKEFFQVGLANVYDLDSMDLPILKSSDNKYNNRLIVRYPESGFSGRVYVDIMNASNNADFEDLWRRSWDWIMDEGHAYIGLTSKDICVESLKTFDANRYSSLTWEVNGASENGLIWDILTQFGKGLKAPGSNGLLGGMQAEYVYLAGQSQSGFYLNTYINTFGDQLDDLGIFDGYLNLVGITHMGINGSGGTPLLNKYYPKPTSTPLIMILSGFENAFSLGGNYFLRKDGDTEFDKFRLYEVAGTPHSDPTSPILPNNDEITFARGEPKLPPTYTGAHVETDANIDPVVNASLEILHSWAKVPGYTPPVGQYLDYTVVGGKWTPSLDAQNNQSGGIRLPQVEVPLARYYPIINGSPFGFSGSMIPFDSSQISALYIGGFTDDYLPKFVAQADALLAAGYLLHFDYDKMIKFANSQSSRF